MYMSSILSVGEFPVIMSKIDINTELLSKKISESEEKKSSEYSSNESIQLGDGVPVRTSTLATTQAQISIQKSEPNYTLTIITFIIFLILAGASYYFYINYKKK